jgi:hypothetical protein
VSGSITGGGGADTLNYSAYTTPVTVNLGANTATGTGGASGFTSLIGGAGNDTLVGPTSNATWNLTGANSGTVGSVTFTRFENLTGAANNADKFILYPSGMLSGTINGGAGGSDQLVFDDGNGNFVTYAPTGSQNGSVVSPAGTTFNYTGLEPISFYQSSFSDPKNVTITGNPIVANNLSLTYYTSALVEISQAGGGESIAFPIPASSLTIDLGDLGSNTLTIGSTSALVLPGALTINGGFPANTVVLAGPLTLGGGLSIDTAVGTTNVTLNSALTVLSGGMTIDNHLALGLSVQLNAAARIQGNVSILGSVLADTVSLNAPLDVLGGNLTIQGWVTVVDEQLALDTVSLDSSVNTHGGDFNVNAATINVGPAGMVSTSDLAPNSTTTYVGDSGAISYSGQTIKIGANAQLLANSDPAGTYSPGDVTLDVNVFDPSGALPVDALPSTNPGITVSSGAEILGGQITLTAEKTSQTQLLPVALLSVQSKTANISIVNATIEGTGVAVQSNAQDADALTGTAYNLVNNLVVAPVNAYVGGMAPPTLTAASVQDRSATATVTVTSSTIHATTGDITIDSTVNVNSNAPAGGGYNATTFKPNPKNPSTVVPYGAGYAEAVGTSGTVINGTTTLTSDSGSVSVTSEATTSATVTTFTASNALFGTTSRKTVSGKTTLPAVAIGITDTDTTAQALVAQDVQITAGGNVDVNATGNVTNNAWAGSASFGDGTGGVGFTLGTDQTTINSHVLGHITAGGVANVLNFNVSTINQTNNTITIPNSGLTTGEAIVYNAAVPRTPSDPLGTPTPLAPIGGLTNGQTYYVIATGPNTIQLAAAPSIDLDATGLDPSETNSLATEEVDSIDASAIDLATSTITLPNHGFTELEPVNPVTTSDWNIQGLQPQGEYYIHVVDANHIQLLTQIAANAGPNPQLLVGTNYYIVPLTATLGSNGQPLTPAGTLLLGYSAAPVTFNPATAVQSDGSLYLPGNTFQTGDLVTYNVVQSTETPVEVDRSAFFSPGNVDVTFNPNASPTTVANDTIEMPDGTTLVTGQRVTYSSGGGTPIGGLASGGVYYVVVTPTDDIQLATTQQNALNGVIIHLTSSGTGTAHVFASNAVDSSDNELVIPNHQLATGQQVVYEAGNGAAVSGLVSGDTYYVISVSTDLLGLALTRQDASAGDFIPLSEGGSGSDQMLETDTFVSTIDTSQTTPVVDYSTNTIELPQNGLATGDIVQYDPGDSDPIGGLTAGPYSVIVVDPDHIRLASVATPNTPIDLVPVTLSPGIQEFTMGDQVFQFDPLIQPTVNLANSSIWLENNGFTTGQEITYLTGGGTPIGGLVDGQTYVVIESADGNSFQLANPSTPTTPIPLTSLGTGSSQGFERASTGDLGAPPIAGLQVGGQYYVTKIDADHIRLSNTLQAAEAAAPIALTLTAAQQANPNLEQYFTASNANPGINVVSSLSAQNTQITESQVGGSPMLSNILLGYIPPAPNAIKAITDKATNVGTAAPFTVDGAVALNFYTHNVQSTIGGSAVLKSATDVTINASSQNYSQVIADGEVITPQYTSSSGSQKLADVAVAVALGVYNNTVLATVDSGASIDASAALTVVSELTYPDLSQFLPYNASAFDVTQPNNGNWMVQLGDALDGRGGLEFLMNVWAHASSTTAGMPAMVSIAGAIGSATYTNDSEATIASGALVNQDQSLQTASQYVGVFADTTMTLLNLAGVIKLQLDTKGLAQTAKSRINSPISPFGNQAGLIGVGGSILLQSVDNTTLAQIDSGAMVHTGTGADGGLGLGATENTVSVNIVLAGGASSLLGVSGAFSILSHASTTVAKLESGVMVYGGPVDVKSESDLNYYNIAGAAQVAGAIGVGASAAVNQITRDTEAYIGAPAGSTPSPAAGTVIDATGLSLSAENTGLFLSVAVAGAVIDPNLAKKASTGSVAGANAGLKPLPVSVGVAGAVGINEVTDTAESYINDDGAIDLGQGNLDILSDNDTRILAVTGSVTLAALNMITVGLAGAVSDNTLDATTESFVAGAGLADAGTISLDAERQGEVLAVTIAAAGSAPSPLTSIALNASLTVDVAASVSLNSISGATLAFVQNAAVVGTGAVSLTANDSSTIDADGGGAAIAISLGGTQALGVAIAVGASVAVNDVTTTVAGYLDDAQVGNDVPVAVASDDSASITAVTVAGAAVFTNAKDVGLAFSGAGAGSGNTIDNTIEAYVEDCKGMQPASLSLLATDNSVISATAVAVALSIALADVFGLSTAISMGGSATVNQVGNDVESFVDDSTITPMGPVKIASVESSSITAVSVGAAFAISNTSAGISAAGAGDGAVATNSISNVVSASIQDKSDLNQTGNGGMTISALDSATIDASADGGALSIGTADVGAGIGLAIGASVAVNTISDQVQADVDNSSVSSAGNLSFTATTQNSIESVVISLSFALAAAGSGSAPIPIGVAVSGAGAGANNTISDTVSADVTNGASVTAAGNVQIVASDDSTISASVSAAAVSASTIAIAAGLSIVFNSITNQIAAYVDGSSVTSTGGGLTIMACATESASATSVGIATALGIGLAAAGATATTTIGTTVEAYGYSATLTSAGSTRILANSSLTGSASTAAASVADGIGIAALVPSISIAGSTLAYVQGASTLNAGSLKIDATSNNQANMPVGLTLAIGIVGGAGAGASASVTHVTEAYAGAETGGASTVINVPQGDVSIVATSTSSATSNVAGGAFGGITIGAFLSTASIGGQTLAFVGPAATVDSASLEIHAFATENAVSDVLAIGVGLIGGTGANATANITSLTEAFAGSDTAQSPAPSGVVLDVTGAIDILANSTGTTTATDQGGTGGGIDVTALLANANDDGQTHAYIGAGAHSVISAGSLNVEADGSLTSSSDSFALGIAAISVSAASSQATVGSSNPDQQTVAAFIELTPGTVQAPGTVTIATSGNVTLTANETPQASAAATGVDAGAISADAATSVANVFGSTTSTLGNGITLSAQALTLDAQRLNSSNPTAEASTTAGSGSILGDVNAALSSATSNGLVQASAGNVVLTGGNVTIEATNNSDQSANSTGVAAGGILAIGADVANATSDVLTQATLGPTATTDLTGTLDVSAMGTDENDVSSTSGSGALFAGDAATGSTTDNSTTSASIGGNLAAGTVLVNANNNSGFSSNVNSVNASAAGGSGAYANNTDNTASNATVLSGTAIVATSVVEITANNTYTETVAPGGNSVTAGGGGVINGNAADSSTNITGNSNVTVDGNVTIDVATLTPAAAAGIFLNASSVLTTSDLVTLSTGGGIEGSGVDSSLNAMLNNNVATSSSSSSPDILFTNEDIGIGTDTQVNASNTSASHTWGVLGAGASAAATTDVTSNQAVNIGPFTTLTAGQNISMSAGDNPIPGATSTTTSMVGSSNAQSYARGLIGVPVAHATTELASNATLMVGANSLIQSGENTTLAADHGTPSALATGIGHGYELFLIPVTNGKSSPRTSTNSTVTMDGTVTAGIYHELDITIPNDQSAPGSFFSNTVDMNSGGYPFTYAFNPSFLPSVFVQDDFSPSNAMTFEPYVSSTAVGAIVLGPLYAAGGNVIVNAGTLSGNGAITAYGGPTITVTNDSPDYLVLSSIDIPNLAGGLVTYAGAASAAPSGMIVKSVNPDASSVVNIQENYPNAVGTSSNNSGPAVFLTGAVTNLGGSFTVTNLAGSVGITSAASVNVGQLNISATQGILEVSQAGTFISGASPYAEFDSDILYPGGDPTTTVLGSIAAEDAVAWVANAMYNADGQYNPNLPGYLLPEESLVFTSTLIGSVGETPAYQTAFPDSGFPTAPEIPRESGTSVVFFGANTGDNSAYTYSDASADSPIGFYYQMGTGNRGYFPVVPVEPLSVSSTTEPTSSGSSAIQADAIVINARVIDCNNTFTVGQSSDLSVTLPASLASTIASDQADYNQGIYSPTPGDARGYYTLTTWPQTPAEIVLGLAPIASSQYDAITKQIIVDNVSAGAGAFISLDGAIMNTDLMGNIQVNDGIGQVTTDNQVPNVPLVVNNVYTGNNALNPTIAPSYVDIIDTEQPSAKEQTLYVYEPGSDQVQEYQGRASLSVQQLQSPSHSSTVTPGNSTNYSPLTGLRWQWQLQANLSRTVSASGMTGQAPTLTATPWAFASSQYDGETNNNDPWYYLDADGNPTAATSNGMGSTPYGELVLEPGLPVFQETITGNIDNWFSLQASYKGRQYGFQPSNPPDYFPDGSEIDPWEYFFVTGATLTLTNSVEADNPIGINFSGASQGFVNITTVSPVILAGNIQNANAETTISAPSITQQGSSATITSSNLTLTSADGVGTLAQPLNASLTAGGVLNVQAGSQGAYINLGSGALLGIVNSGGDVVLNATGSLDAAPGMPAGTVNITGNNLTLNSATGEVGTPTAPLEIQANGVVNASALLDIGMNQQSGALQVGQIISTSGDVSLDPGDSPIESASTNPWASEVDDAQSQQVWQDLSLTNPSDAVRQTITAFQNQVTATYAAYWQLIENGSVQNGAFVLSAQGVSLFSGRAGLYLNIANATNAQVQAFANSQYQNYVAFFNQNLAPNWASSTDFQTYNPSFSYAATAQQQSDFSSEAGWTSSELMNPLAQVALDPATGAPVAISTPNISGKNVTLVATGTGGNIGQTGDAPTFIPASDLRDSGTLSSAELEAIGSATATRDAFFVYANNQNQQVILPFGQQPPSSYTFSGLEVYPTEQLFVSATGDLAMSAGGTITVQATSQDLTLSQVSAGGTVNISAPESILSAGAGAQISTPGDLVLKVVTGTVGSPTAPLNVQQVAGSTYVFTPPNSAFLTGGATTSLAITSSTGGSSTYGSSVTFTATVSDNGAGVPTGTVGFYSGTTFLGQGTALSGSGNSATSTFTTSTLAAGSYPSIIAVFTPTGHFAGSSSTLGFTVNRAPVTITASPSPTSVTLQTTAPTLTDSATLASGDDETGTITFTLYHNGGSPVDTETVTVSGNGTYSTPKGYTLPTSGTVTGTYQWDASYSGDPNNSADSDINAANEVVAVSAANPTLTTTASPAVTLGTTAPTISDAAVLAGGYYERGTISFTLMLGSTTVYTTTDSVSGNGTYSASYASPTTGTVTGTYAWTDSYSGDPNNKPSSGNTGASEQTVVSPANPALTTTASPAVTLGTTAPTISDSAVLTAGYYERGTISFTLTLGSTTVYTTTDPVSGNGTYSASYTLPTTGTVTGTYAWTDSYSGDTNNRSASGNTGASEQTVVSPANPTLTTTASPAVTLGTTAPTISDAAVLAGGYYERGTISFTLMLGSTTVYTTTDPVSGNGTYSVSCTLPTTGTVTGTYAWTDSYSGDTNNNPASGNTGASEQTVVSKASPTLTATATTTNPTFGATTAVIGTGTGFVASGTLSGGYYETGTITFTLYGPTNTIVDTETVTPNGNGNYNTPSPFVPTVPGTYQWVVSFAGDGNNNSFSTSKGNTSEVAVGPGATIVCSALYLVGGTTNDQVNVQQVGKSNTGSTGIVVSGQLNGANLNPPTQYTYNSAPATIYIVLFDGNDQICMEPTLTIPAVVGVGKGNDQIQLGQGNNFVTAGDGNDQVQAGNGNNLVTVGIGNDNIQLGNGNNTVTVGSGNDCIQLGNGNNGVVAGNGNDNIQLGGGNNTVNVGSGNDQVQAGNGNNVVVEGNGNDQVSAGTGDNLIVGGTGHHTLQVGNGSNILIDGSVGIANNIAALDQILSEWIDYGNTSANVATIRSQLGVVTYNATNANKLQAGSGLDWFWYTYAKDQSNRKATDLLN